MRDPLEDQEGPWGDADQHLTRDALEAAFAAFLPAPKGRGRVTLLVSRIGGGKRETPESVLLTTTHGMPDDAWGRDPDRKPDAQLAIMRSDVATLVANGQPLTLFGDNLFVDLDLSTGNLPHGTRLQVGDALLEVTPEPHDGCSKFRQRFGDGALRMTADPQRRDQHLRGIYMRVIGGGRVQVGDSMEVLARAPIRK